jgi:zinc protease
MIQDLSQSQKWQKIMRFFCLTSPLFIMSYVAHSAETDNASSKLPTSVESPKSYETTNLTNGLQVIMLPSSKVALATFVLVFKAGAMTETPETNGMTHLWEHMFFKGNARLPKQEDFVRRVRQLGISYNGDTSAEMVRYYFTLPSVYLEEGMQFMADAIQTAKLNLKELEKERVVVLNEYERNASDPGFESGALRRKLIYGDQSYLRDPLGTKKIILSATVKQLQVIKQEVFVPKNGALMISGDFKVADVKRLSNKYFGKWQNPKNWSPPKRPDFPEFPKTMDILSTDKQFENAKVIHSFLGPKVLENPKDTFAADFLSGLLSHKQNQFYKTFMESGLTLGGGISYHTQNKAGEIHLYAETTPENLIKVKDLLLLEIPKWTQPDYFTAEQFEDVRTGLEISRIKETAIPSAFIKELAFWWAIPGLPYYDTYESELKKVTFADVKDFVEKWLLNKNHLTTSVVNEAQAQKLGLENNSKELAEKLLKEYR